MIIIKRNRKTFISRRHGLFLQQIKKNIKRKKGKQNRNKNYYSPEIYMMTLPLYYYFRDTIINIMK